MDGPRPIDLTDRLSFACPATLLQRLAQRYAEPHRRYHTWEHVAACLDARRRVTEAALPEVDLALLFHDAIYQPLAHDNEVRSAELLVEEGRRAWLNDHLLQRARVLVEATKHDRLDDAVSEEACIVLDADLSILGSEAAVFESYERHVREEFAAVDDAAYAVGRGAVLRAFLDRPAIYVTRTGRRLWEGCARRNLERSLATLTGG